MATTPDGFQSEEYLKHITQVKLVNEIYEGTDTAATHIQQFNKEGDTDYAARKKEANLDNYVFRTVQTTKNIIFRKPIDETNITDDSLTTWFENINFKVNLNTFAKKALVNRIKDGYTYIMVDTSKFDVASTQSQARQMQENIRPYFSNITRSQVPFVEYDDYGNIIVFPIMETYQKKDGRFGWTLEQQTRVYEFVDGVVNYSLWRDGEEVENDIIDIPLIPVVKIGDDSVPPLYDQAKLNVNHLNRNSEKSNYVRIGAAPFLAIWGQKTDQKVTLGIMDGISFGNVKPSDADIKWIEMSGSNYQIIQEEIKYKEEQMERISVEFVTQLKNATATEVEKSSTANESRLADYSQELEEGINKAISYIGLYTEKDYSEQMIVVNKDFDSAIMTADEFNMLMQLRTNGDLSYDRFMTLLERGELLPMLDDKERKTEVTRLKDDT